MGFKSVRKKAIECLLSGNVQHKLRDNIDVKNLLHTGEVNTDEVIEFLKQTKGTQYKSSPHHYDSSIDVHICQPMVRGTSWYVKFYFLEPNLIFISVHH